MMSSMLRRTGSHPERQDLVVTPGQLQAGMNFDEEVDEQWHEGGPGQHMRADDVEGKIGQQDKCDPFGDGELVRDLSVHLRVSTEEVRSSIERNERRMGEPSGRVTAYVDQKKGVSEDLPVMGLVERSEDRYSMEEKVDHEEERVVD